jgi:signal transduction histidine kinase
VDEAIVEIGGILRTFSALLRISEVEDGARRAGFSQVSLSQIAADVAEFYEPAAEAAGVDLAWVDAAPSGAPMAGDPSLLFEALGNLVDNAIKFTPAGGRVEIRVASDGRGRPSATVRDTGPGIDPAERETLLQPFRRSEKGRDAPGHGLGLTLVAAIAKLHGLPLAIEDAAPGCRVRLG